ncbi:MAG: 2-C-methyl-D-erythritol 4-phosphate cytidylyltransferase [Verrucomicrobia bacterium]|nr:2-C-methyl-D-erythritol 4-phosphate cytidylyltransferase [Verrucomicrobiota bacterium]
MGKPIPKQYLLLKEKPIILHTLEAFLTFQDWGEIVIVCEPIYQSLFSSYNDIPLRFAPPGKTRQDSLFSGFDALLTSPEWICIHDGARPLLKEKDLRAVIDAGKIHGAATLATPVKTTIKEVDNDLVVKKTLLREKLWSIQTPQILRKDLLQKGRNYVTEKNITVTDDVSLAELLDHPVKLVEGSDSNIKITTQEDLSLANLLLKRSYA